MLWYFVNALLLSANINSGNCTFNRIMIFDRIFGPGRFDNVTGFTVIFH